METLIQHHEVIAIFIVRIILGILFFYQGYDIVFNLKINTVIETYEVSFANKGIPKFITRCGAWFTSYSELICGFLLIFGLFEYVALYILGINLIFASLAFSINTPMWNTQHVFSRLTLLLILLLTPTSWHMYSIDYLLFKN